MNKGRTSISRLIWMVFCFLLFMLVALLIVSFVSYIHNAEETERAWFEKQWDSYVQQVQGDIDNATQTLLWVAGSMENEEVFNENYYQRMLVTRYTEGLLDRTAALWEQIDAVLIAFHDSDVLLEIHSMEEGDFLQFLHVYGGKNAHRLSSASLFQTEDGRFTHFLMQAEAIVYSTMGNEQNVALVTMALDLDSLLKKDLEAGNTVLLCREYGEQLIPFYSAGEGMEGWKETMALEDIAQKDTLQKDGVTYRMAASALGYGNFYIVFLCPQNTALHWGDMLSYRTFAVILAIVVLTALCIIYILRQVHTSSRKIIGDIDRISAGDQDYRLEENPLSEFSRIAQAVNHLLDELRRSNDKNLVIREELFQKQLLLKERQNLALQAQINPHFLYNTLECIQSISQCSGITEIPIIVNAMSYIYRYSVAGIQLGTVEEELQCVRQYEKIMQIRFGNCFRFSIEGEESCALLPIPRMVLQPIVENAFTHGILSSEKEDKEIVLRCCRQDKSICIRVWDNGIGISPKRLKELERTLSEGGGDSNLWGHGIGLRNIHLRLKNIYGDDCGLKIQSVEGEYTEITFKIPEEVGADREEKTHEA